MKQLDMFSDTDPHQLNVKIPGQIRLCEKAGTRRVAPFLGLCTSCLGQIYKKIDVGVIVTECPYCGVTFK